MRYNWSRTDHQRSLIIAPPNAVHWCTTARWKVADHVSTGAGRPRITAPIVSQLEGSIYTEMLQQRWEGSFRRGPTSLDVPPSHSLSSSLQPFDKILVANRGEIACRVSQTSTNCHKTWCMVAGFVVGDENM